MKIAGTLQTLERYAKRLWNAGVSQFEIEDGIIRVKLREPTQPEVAAPMVESDHGSDDPLNDPWSYSETGHADVPGFSRLRRAHTD